MGCGSMKGGPGLRQPSRALPKPLLQGTPPGLSMPHLFPASALSRGRCSPREEPLGTPSFPSWLPAPATSSSLEKLSFLLRLILRGPRFQQRCLLSPFLPAPHFPKAAKS